MDGIKFGLSLFLGLIIVAQSNGEPADEDAAILNNFGLMTDNIKDDPFISQPEIFYNDQKTGNKVLKSESNWGFNFKQIPTNIMATVNNAEIMRSLQLAVGVETKRFDSKPKRDLLMEDFDAIEEVEFSSFGSDTTPAHDYREFTFTNYAPRVYEHFRKLYGFSTGDYLSSIGNEQSSMHELSNPAASGSALFLTRDDKFITKTVSHYEADFLLSLLPQYYMNVKQNPRTLLPKYFGQYSYSGGGINMRLVVMTNLLPSSVKMHEKYDLKGSVYHREASDREKKKSAPTFRDVDFRRHHKEGFALEPTIYEALMKTLEADLNILESFKIQDYSFLLGVHVLDPSQDIRPIKAMTLKSLEENGSFSAVPAKNEKGENVLLFMGIIDVLQSFRLKKRLEYTLKSMLHDYEIISINKPSYYRQRFQEFLSHRVLRPAMY